MSWSSSFALEGSSRYAAFRRQLDRESVSLLRDESLTFTELELQSLWFAGAFGREFVSVSGEPVEVVQFGHWNHSAGPDFVDAAVRVGDTVRRGAIELDPDARDWERHGHGESEDFEEVVLHVFFNTGPERFFTRTRDHREVSQVKLVIGEDIDLEPLTYFPADAHLGRCSYVFAGLADEVVDEILKAAAQFRLERKARRLARTREIHGEEQALFQGMGEAFGYRHNAFPLRVLTQRASLSRVMKLTSPGEIDALFFGLAGFLEGCGHVESSSEETTEYQRDLWSRWWHQRETWSAATALPLPWKTAGVRPQNHPQRRLGALTSLTASWKSWMRLTAAESIDIPRVERFLTRLTHFYWDQHYTLKAVSAKRLALIGTARARDAVVNQILPLRFAKTPQETWAQFQQLRALQSNEKIRRAAVRLFGEHPRQEVFLKKAYHQQALLQIYDDFCLSDSSGCEDCPFPEQLWKMVEVL